MVVINSENTGNVGSSANSNELATLTSKKHSSDNGLHFHHSPTAPVLLGMPNRSAAYNGVSGQPSPTSPSILMSADGANLSDRTSAPWKKVSHDYKPLSERIRNRMASGDVFYSLEFFPPRTANGVANLLARLERMGEGSPLFVDITWHPAGDPASDKDTSSSSIAGAALNFCRLETMLHMCCAQYTVAEVLRHLERAKCLGIRNILALRGDLFEDVSQPGELPYATDMVKLIREHYGDYFVIGVAGYPTGHPDATSYDDDLRYLKEKVDAGADFIITQLFFDFAQFERFVHDCHQLGIRVPIIPGIMPIQSYDSLRHIVKLSKLDIPQEIVDVLEPLKNNDEAIRLYGVQFAVDLCQKLLANKLSCGLHFYTLNREVATRDILQKLGLWHQIPMGRALPWKHHTAHHKRCKEDVRPIFWSGRPKSYIYRTKDWDDFPNGRWGNSSSPAFGELKDYYMFYLRRTPEEKGQMLRMWGEELRCEHDIWHIFQCFVTGSLNRFGRKVTCLPWNEEDLAAETQLLSEQLKWCNHHGILTINSQPNVNAAPSSDPIVGWGNHGGYVYQKAYLEFFANRQLVDALCSVLKKEEWEHINFHISDSSGAIDITNSSGNTPMAVTWGVFPGQEICQPTVVDPLSFRVWKDEAFGDWLNLWASLYPDSSKSKELIQHVHDTYCLVCLVDNEFPKPCSLWDLLAEALTVADQPQPSNCAHCAASHDDPIELVE